MAGLWVYTGLFEKKKKLYGKKLVQYESIPLDINHILGIYKHGCITCVLSLGPMYVCVTFSQVYMLGVIFISVFLCLEYSHFCDEVTNFVHFKIYFKPETFIFGSK